ncbi:hypothetical protein [uncultured Albimonas sp.]|uniref:hypothetical protein n=1 Tax=uncultured Albimonas sp. TaxID=1331701 RepID=UPI0030ED13F8|tara:strand:+ start:451 stop:651 length:201 start_codon:yes stop_codon:yes gene_type:complete
MTGIKLTDLQPVLLSAASARPDFMLLPAHASEGVDDQPPVTAPMPTEPAEAGKPPALNAEPEPARG